MEHWLNITGLKESSMGICTSMFPFSENVKHAPTQSQNQYLLLTNHASPQKQISLVIQFP